MSERIYLGTILGIDDKYYRGVFEPDRLEINKSSTSFSSELSVITDCGEFLLVSGLFNFIYKVDKKSLAILGSLSLIAQAGKMKFDGVYAYVAGSFGLKKVNVSDMTIISSNDTDFLASSALDVDIDFIYAANGRTLRKINKSTLEIVGTVTLPDTCSSIGVDENFLYIGMGSSTNAQIYNKSDLTLNRTLNTTFRNDVFALDNESYYFTSENFVYKSNKTTDSTQSYQYSGSTSNVINVLAVDSEYLYVGGNTIKTIQKIDKNTMVIVKDSPAFDYHIKGLIADGSYLYVTNGTRIVKLNNFNKLIGWEVQK